MGTDLSGWGFLPPHLLASKRLQLVPGATEVPSFQEPRQWGPGLKGPFSQAWAPRETQSRYGLPATSVSFGIHLPAGGTVPTVSFNATIPPSGRMAAHTRME